MSEKEKLEILEQLLIEDEHEEINRLSSEANDCKYKRSYNPYYCDSCNNYMCK